MTVQRAIGGLIAALFLAFALGVPASAMAQTAVTTADIQRLQDEVYQASNDVSRLRTSDALAGRTACRTSSMCCARRSSISR